MSIDILLITGASISGFAAAWDLGRRWITGFSSVAHTAKDELTGLVIRAETAAERNELALTNFLAQIRELVKFTERARREAEGQVLTGASSSRGTQRR